MEVAKIISDQCVFELVAELLTHLVGLTVAEFREYLTVKDI